jgi:hypothetical protein
MMQAWRRDPAEFIFVLQLPDELKNDLKKGEEILGDTFEKADNDGTNSLDKSEFIAFMLIKDAKFKAKMQDVQVEST